MKNEHNQNRLCCWWALTTIQYSFNKNIPKSFTTNILWKNIEIVREIVWCTILKDKNCERKVFVFCNFVRCEYLKTSL